MATPTAPMARRTVSTSSSLELVRTPLEYYSPSSPRIPNTHRNNRPPNCPRPQEIAHPLHRLRVRNPTDLPNAPARMGHDTPLGPIAHRRLSAGRPRCALQRGLRRPEPESRCSYRAANIQWQDGRADHGDGSGQAVSRESAEDAEPIRRGD
jgi:hypothetical protein